jgi:hypothetical protein
MRGLCRENQWYILSFTDCALSRQGHSFWTRTAGIGETASDRRPPIATFHPPSSNVYLLSSVALQQRLVTAVGRLSGDVVNFLNQSQLWTFLQNTIDDGPVFFGLYAAR